MRRLVAALDGQIHLPANAVSAKSPEAEMNFGLEGGDESPHSKSPQGVYYGFRFKSPEALTAASVYQIA